jgi:16S rRNA (guanine966-N2)-methyltransferase
MRIITGKFKGRSITSIPNRNIRPATDRVKTTIYDMLQNRLSLNGAEVLDLFAGSGNLGFEAISRGAKEVIFVDDDPDALDIIEENAKKLNCIDQCQIIDADALSFIVRTKMQFDLIFADPPYAYVKTLEIPNMVFEKSILRADGLLIIEHTKHVKFEGTNLYDLSVQKEFGNTRVSFFIHPKEEGKRK